MAHKHKAKKKKPKKRVKDCHQPYHMKLIADDMKKTVLFEFHFSVKGDSLDIEKATNFAKNYSKTHKTCIELVLARSNYKAMSENRQRLSVKYASEDWRLLYE